MSRFSEFAKARLWRKNLPVLSTESLMEGAAKALLCGAVYPLMLLIAAVLLAVVGPPALGHMALALPLTAAALTGAAGVFMRTLPFTVGSQRSSSFDLLPRFMGAMLLMSVLAGGHALVLQHWLSHTVAIVLTLGLLRRGWRGLSHWTG